MMIILSVFDLRQPNLTSANAMCFGSYMEKAVPSADYALAELTQLWDVTTQADKKIISNNQKGVDSQFYRPGRLSEMERFEQHFLDWYIKTLKTAVISK